ncbi:foldase protein PrsA 1 precursor [Clostridium acetireducens DSM 10703]|uniref:Foldase protein PrsA n=1 Tax=Clostridium acetireducens DSM 10703 TaxID=1121290 RepID=A0A1E8EZN2_9CLOT|nr:peptidylprolyl isomerase [Clostridium acetireducens]OFI06575.1 foldase protein PrsA 1 precursor [Clostridium acetireducens DSM 10703]
MNNRKIKRLISGLLISGFVFFAFGCDMIEKTPEAIAKSTVAKVNSEKITRGDLDNDPQMKQIVAQLKQQYGENYEKSDEGKEILKEQKKNLLEGMVNEKLVLQKAKELKVIPTVDEINKEVDKEITYKKKQFAEGNDKKFNEILSKSGITEKKLKEDLRKIIEKSLPIKNVIEHVTKNVKIDDKKALTYYNSHQLEFTEKPNKIHTAHILVKTEDEAKKVKERLNKGEDFAKVAKEVSQDPGSKDKGGDLGFVEVANSGFDAKFMAGAMALKEGEISAPVQTSFGFHIIKCIKKEEYPVKKFDLVKKDIISKLEEEEKRKVFMNKLEEWKKASKIETKKYEKNLI